MFDTQQMAHGGLALILEPAASWEEFSHYAEVWAERIKAGKASRPVLSVNECLLQVRIRRFSVFHSVKGFGQEVQ